MLNISQVILVRIDSNLCRKELTVHWIAPNSLIRSYLQPCTNSIWGGWKWSCGTHYLILPDCGCPKGGSFLSRSHNSPATCTVTVGQRKKVTAVTLFRCPTVIVMVQFETRTHTEPALDGLTHWPLGLINLYVSNFQSNFGNWRLMHCFSESALSWHSRDPIDDESTSVQVMAWYRQATSH